MASLYVRSERQCPGRARRALSACVAALLSAGLAGCGSIGDDTAARALTSPGKFDVLRCQEIVDRVGATQKRQVELEQLMARASQAPGGTLIGSMAYRTEYLQTRGDLEELAKSAADKKCAAESKWSSQRALF